VCLSENMLVTSSCFFGAGECRQGGACTVSESRELEILCLVERQIKDLGPSPSPFINW
jgi:hypothetical protein